MYFTEELDVMLGQGLDNSLAKELQMYIKLLNSYKMIVSKIPSPISCVHILLQNQ